MEQTIQRLSNNLWFDNEAAEADKYYTGIFKNSSIGKSRAMGAKASRFIKGRPAR